MLTEDTLLTESEILKLLSATKALKKGKPLQYVIGSTDFMGLNIKCDERALIPRPETEELMHWVIDSHSELNEILDIGTGTGCIPLALKNEFQSTQAHGVDVEAQAIELARENSALLQLEVKFLCDDILNPKGSYPKFDLIISNPPYVRSSESEEMRENVLAHEPHSALFVQDNDPLIFYRAIMNFAKEHLIDSGLLYFEINESFEKEMRALFAESGFTEIESKKDIYGKDRMMRGKVQPL
jgi:release factor glutamine methyltransferase